MTDQNQVRIATSASIDQAHTEQLTIVRDFAILLAVVGLVAVFLSGALAAVIAAAAPLWLQIPLGLAFGIAVLITVSVVRGLGFARQAIAVKLFEYQEDRENAREIARIQATQTTNVSIRGKQNVVSVNSAQRVEDIRLLPVTRAQTTRLLDGVPEADLVFFAERAPMIGHSQRAWMGTELPSGARVATFQDYDKLLQPFVKAGLIVDRRERSAGKLVSGDSDELKRRLGLPTGPQDTLGASTKNVTPAA